MAPLSLSVPELALLYDLLKLSDYDRWSDPMYEQFGTEDGLPWGDRWPAFEDWLEEHRVFFEREPGYESNRPKVELIDTEARLAELEIIPGQQQFILQVDPYGTRKSITAQFTAILKRLYPTERGEEHGAAEDQEAHWEPRVPIGDIGYIRKTLEVREKLLGRETLPADQQPRNWEIAIACKLSTNVPQDFDPNADVQLRTKLEINVRNYFKRAEDLIRGVENMVFPAAEGYGAPYTKVKKTAPKGR